MLGVIIEDRDLLLIVYHEKKINLIAALPLSISLKPLAAQNEKIFIIDKQTVYQEIDNFSASDAWRCAFIGKNWPQEKKKNCRLTIQT